VKLRFHDEATAELEEALDWYAVRSPDAQRAFAMAIDHSLASLLAGPLRFAQVMPGFRAVRVEKFPYQLIYRVTGEVAIVVAVAHLKRQPGYWKRRK
jgi:plasmid stabilization system protein ParE